MDLGRIALHCRSGVKGVCSTGRTPWRRSSVVENIANLPSHSFKEAFVAASVEGGLPHGIDVRIVKFRRRQVTNRAVNQVHAQDRRVRKPPAKLALKNGISFATTAHEHRVANPPDVNGQFKS